MYMMPFNGTQINLNKTEMLLIITSLISLTAAIRVDWNTNKGPIVPPTTTQRPIPQPPYQNPAPVWENQSDEINPNMYQYVLPPPSRPKFLTDNYARAPISSQDEYRYQHEKQPNYGQVITTFSTMNNVENYNNNIIKTVPTLAVYYVPNVGLKYDAVVPSSLAKSYYLKENDIYDKYNTKLNGKYNYKLKKYKAYEKMKYIPNLYYTKPSAVKQQYNPLPYVSQEQQQQQQHNSSHYQYSSTEQSFNSPKFSSQNSKDLNRSQKDVAFKTQSSSTHQQQNQWQFNRNSINELTSNSKPER